MQAKVSTEQLPAYTDELLSRELQLFPEWYLQKHLNYSASSGELNSLKQIFDLLVANAKAQPQVFVHRDFHSRNLMVTAENTPGILDFQDAVSGAITYDLVSLYRDAYIQWDEEQQMDSGDSLLGACS
jgi:aminoglycoside/choline kinase family phosphotransferase